MILGGLILGNKAAPWLIIWVWIWNRNLMPSNFPTVPGWIFQSWSTSIFPWFFASREKCRHPSLGRNGPRVDTTYAWPCCPSMFLPKRMIYRMIFPETANLSERCSNLSHTQYIIFHNETTTIPDGDFMLPAPRIFQSCQPSGNEDLLSTSWGRLPSRRAKRHGTPQPGVRGRRGAWKLGGFFWEMFHAMTVPVDFQYTHVNSWSSPENIYNCYVNSWSTI